MNVSDTLSRFENALGKRHPDNSAMLWERIEFIEQEIKKLKTLAKLGELKIKREGASANNEVQS
jgi:hypothetical protein